MSKKTFSTAPKPKTNQLSPEEIEAFEQGGAGHDTKSAPVLASASKAKAGQGRAVPKKKKELEAVVTVETAKRRLSLDLPETTHVRFKTACSATDRRMTVEVQEFIERRTEELEKQAGLTRN